MSEIAKVYLCCDVDEMIEDLGEQNFTRGLTKWVRLADYESLASRLAAAEAREQKDIAELQRRSRECVSLLEKLAAAEAVINRLRDEVDKRSACPNCGHRPSQCICG